MSTIFYHNKNGSFTILNPENKSDILKTKITILLLIGIFSIIFGCLPIFLERTLFVKNFFLNIFKIFKKSKNVNDDIQSNTRTATPSTSIHRHHFLDLLDLENDRECDHQSKFKENYRKHQNFHSFIKFILCFGGGVLFFTSFVHLHPEIREIFKTLEARHIFTNTIPGMGGIQTSELLICCGFFLIYLLEELMHYLIAIREMRNNSEFALHRALTKCNPVIFWKRHRNIDNNSCNHQDAVDKRRYSNERNEFLDTYECHFGFDPDVITMDEFTNNERKDSLPMECPLSSMSSSNYGDTQSQTFSTINTQTMSYIQLNGIEECSINHPLSASSTTHLMETSSGMSPPIPPLPSHITLENNYDLNKYDNLIYDNGIKQNRPNKSVTFSMDNKDSNRNSNTNDLRSSVKQNSNTPVINNIERIVDDYDIDKNSNFQTILRGLVAIFALSIHSLFEGLAVGLEKNISSIWYLFLAIGTHKFVIIFCVGIELVAAKLKSLWITIYIIGFALVTPLGILIGALISHSYYDTDYKNVMHSTKITNEGLLLTIAAMLQAVSAGTLLYVIFFEILIKERHHHHHFEANSIKTKKSEISSHLHHSAESLIQCFSVGCGFMFMVGLHALISKAPHGHSH